MRQRRGSARDNASADVPGYSRGVSRQGARGRLPFLAFVLLAIVCLALIGFACACLDDQFAQVLDRVAQSMPAAVIVLWAGLATVARLSLPLIAFEVPALGRASPALLQRFLF